MKYICTKDRKIIALTIYKHDEVSYIYISNFN